MQFGNFSLNFLKRIYNLSSKLTPGLCHPQSKSFLLTTSILMIKH